MRQDQSVGIKWRSERFSQRTRAWALRFVLGLAVGVASALAFEVPATAQANSNSHNLQIEGAAIWQSMNRVGIPGDTGTRFDLVDFGRGPVPGFRAYWGYRWKDRHEVRALFAPLAFEQTGQFDSSVSYQDVNFAANTSTTATYKFNSYRLTYAYHFDATGDWEWALGFTAKVRDAQIRLTQGAVTATKDNVGFVPLLHARAAYSISPAWKLRFDLDGLAAPQGRAVDALIAADYKLNENFNVYAGYRTVEGGADNKTVYNFAWLHFATLGIGLAL